MARLFALLLLVCCSNNVFAQTTMHEAGLRNHIAVDVGAWIPFGEVGQKLDMQPGFGFNIHFWKPITEETFLVGSVGNSWLYLGTHVETDSGLQDLSSYSMTASPLLGGLGYILSTSETFNFWAIVNAGATIINVTQGRSIPVTYIENNAYFSLGGVLGASYAVSENVSMIMAVRYQKLFGDDLQHVDLGVGASFKW